MLIFGQFIGFDWDEGNRSKNYEDKADSYIHL